MDEAEVKDKRVSQLEQDVATLRSDIERLQIDSTRQNDEIESLRYEISWKDGRISYLEKELARSSTSS